MKQGISRVFVRCETCLLASTSANWIRKAQLQPKSYICEVHFASHLFLKVLWLRVWQVLRRVPCACLECIQIPRVKSDGRETVLQWLRGVLSSKHVIPFQGHHTASNVLQGAMPADQVLTLRWMCTNISAAASESLKRRLWLKFFLAGMSKCTYCIAGKYSSATGKLLSIQCCQIFNVLSSVHSSCRLAFIEWQFFWFIRDCKLEWLWAMFSRHIFKWFWYILIGFILAFSILLCLSRKTLRCKWHVFLTRNRSAGIALCSLCEQGKFATGYASEACLTCGEGKYQSSPGMSSCSNYNFVDVCLERGPGCFYYSNPQISIVASTICCYSGT